MKTHKSNQDWLSLLLLIAITTSIDPTHSQTTTTYVPAENILLNCGAPSDAQYFIGGRAWDGDIGSNYSGIQNTISATLSNQNSSIPTVPYMTARIFQTQFTYTFNVTSGRKFIRLYFYPSNYTNPNFNASNSSFTVSVGSYILLRNFSALLTTQAMNRDYMTKEFSINILSNTLNLTFAPSSAKENAFAFVNGIEIVSTPQIFGDSDTFNQPLIVGTTSTLTIDKHTALETVVRLNVGGQSVSPVVDSGLYREWDDDSPYIYRADVGVTYLKDPNVTIKYSDTIPEYIAPPLVYGTARSMGPNTSANLNYNLTWIATIDAGFYYLVRLHFCEIDYSVTEINMRVFDVFINNMTAKTSFDVIAYSGGIDVPVYLDFIVFFPNTSASSQQDLWVALHPNIASKPGGYDAELNGLEIFKLNDSTGNLYAPNLSNQQTVDTGKKKRIRHFLFLVIGVCGPILVILLLAFITLRHWRQRHKLILQSSVSSLSSRSNQSRVFSFSEIKTATKHFSESLVIGVGGFGKVYRGEIDGGSTCVAVKRGNRLSGQGAHEFRTEIEILSKLRHRHLVSLANWALHCKRNNTIDQIIDPNLKDDVSPDSLEKFVETAEKCLIGQGIERPSMGDVLWNLEVALQMQSNIEKGESRFDPISISNSQALLSSIVSCEDSVFSELRSSKGR
ncbi:Receptor-like protein kinase FERONIA [Acorus calamus]|uniref:Receptor-like protein kinase FERONIA n=1 Tax=Acorus calamus TaxID=4465 RepID=A0AAV9C5L3_ACOCL|nr:Receptor-like protein kinase FERONIA [Acorus calamus]